MDGGAWCAAVHGGARSRTRLSDFTFTFHFHALGKEMATHSSVLAWRIPGTGEPGGLPSMGSHRVEHDWSNLAAAAAAAAAARHLCKRGRVWDLFVQFSCFLHTCLSLTPNVLFSLDDRLQLCLSQFMFGGSDNRPSLWCSVVRHSVSRRDRYWARVVFWMAHSYLL